MKCSICRTNIARGTGKMYVRNDGRIFYFCSSKCHKNFKLGRVEKGLKWARRDNLTKKAHQNKAAKA